MNKIIIVTTNWGAFQATGQAIEEAFELILTEEQQKVFDKLKSQDKQVIKMILSEVK